MVFSASISSCYLDQTLNDQLVILDVPTIGTIFGRLG
jgi:hypothetical protein